MKVWGDCPEGVATRTSLSTVARGLLFFLAIALATLNGKSIDKCLFGSLPTVVSIEVTPANTRIFQTLPTPLCLCT